MKSVGLPDVLCELFTYTFLKRGIFFTLLEKKMAVFHVIPQRIGQMANTARRVIGSVDKGIRTTNRVFQAVKQHIPDGRIKKAAEKGLSDYESVREKIRLNAQMP